VTELVIKQEPTLAWFFRDGENWGMWNVVKGTWSWCFFFPSTCE